jgi:hypothetical protein
VSAQSFEKDEKMAPSPFRRQHEVAQLTATIGVYCVVGTSCVVAVVSSDTLWSVLKTAPGWLNAAVVMCQPSIVVYMAIRPIFGKVAVNFTRLLCLAMTIACGTALVQIIGYVPSGVMENDGVQRFAAIMLFLFLANLMMLFERDWDCTSRLQESDSLNER